MLLASPPRTTHQPVACKRGFALSRQRLVDRVSDQADIDDAPHGENIPGRTKYT